MFAQNNLSENVKTLINKPYPSDSNSRAIRHAYLMELKSLNQNEQTQVLDAIKDERLRNILASLINMAGWGDNDEKDFIELKKKCFDHLYARVKKEFDLYRGYQIFKENYQDEETDQALRVVVDEKKTVAEKEKALRHLSKTYTSRETSTKPLFENLARLDLKRQQDFFGYINRIDELQIPAMNAVLLHFKQYKNEVFKGFANVAEALEGYMIFLKINPSPPANLGGSSIYSMRSLSQAPLKSNDQFKIPGLKNS